MIRIDSSPLSDVSFAEAFFEVWDGLGLRPDDTNPPKQLQLLALMSFHVFLKEKVDVAIYETHHGGELDATNVIQHPIVTAIATLCLDHRRELGGTLENIAWHKAGIFKPGACALSVPQQPEATMVLKSRARERNADLKFIDLPEDLPGHFPCYTQRINASLAREACNAFLNRQKPGGHLTKQDIEDGIRNFNWPGRYQVVKVDGLTWCLDAAHDPTSAAIAANWFIDIPKPKSYDSLPLVSGVQLTQISAKSVLLLGQTGDRHDPLETLRVFRDTLSKCVSSVVLTTSDNQVFDLSRLHQYSEMWKEQSPGTTVIISECHDAIEKARGLGTHHFVTGNPFVVGFALKRLGQSCA